MKLNHILLENLNESNVQLFKIRNFDANQIIHNEHDLCTTVDFILSGRVLISSISHSGKEEIFNNLSKDEVLGNVLIFANDPYYLGDVIAITPNTQIASISKNDLFKVFSNDTRFMEAYMNLVCSETLLAKKRQKLLLQKTIQDRIIYYLEMNGNKLKIKSIAQLAIDLSYPRPSLSRVLNKMIDEGLIEYKDKILTIK